MANLAGNVGPMVLLYKTTFTDKTLNKDVDIIKVPMIGCHPSGLVGPFSTYLWFYQDKPIADVLENIIRNCYPFF